LFTHCSETSLDPRIAARWIEVFARCGLDLRHIRTGCCGMAGTFGHERDKVGMSRRLYDMTWRKPIEAVGSKALATGFSCRCQVKRFSGQRPAHPVEVLLSAFSGD